MDAILLIVGLALGAVFTWNDRRKKEALVASDIEEADIKIPPTEPPKEVKDPKKKEKPSSCEVCNGEKDIYLAGQKIKCPKCKNKYLETATVSYQA